MLIRSNDILKEYAQVTGTVNYNGLLASLRMIELKYMVPVLSIDLYTVLNAAIDAATEQDPLAPEWFELLHHCRMAIGPLFCYFHADKADVKFSDAGMQRSESSGMKNAYQEQRTKFKEANLQEGEDALELLMAFLEKNRADYPEWTDSDNFKKYKSLFIKTGTEFNELFQSHTPHRNYFLMRSKMADIEKINIRTFLGKALYDELKTEDAKTNPDFSEEETELLGYLKKAIANLTVANAVPFLNVRIGSNGLTVPAVALFSQDDSLNTRAGIDHKMIDTYIIACTAAGREALTQAQTFLTDNETTFTNWIGFATTEAAEESPLNEGNDSVWGM